MSILKTEAGMRRAAETVKTANAAKRGMFALLERRHSYVSLRDGYHAYRTYVPGIVTSVSRDGMAKRMRVKGHGADFQIVPSDTLLLDTRGQIANPETVCAALTSDFGIATEFDTLEAARVAIKATVGLA
jgi:hypothetical protein